MICRRFWAGHFVSHLASWKSCGGRAGAVLRLSARILSRKRPSSKCFDICRLMQICSGSSADRMALTTDIYYNLTQLSSVGSSAGSPVFSDRLHRYLQGYDDQLLGFVDKHFLNMFSFCLVEELKKDDPDSNRAWRAFQLYLLRDLSSQLSQMRLEQHRASQLIEEIDARTKRIEAGQMDEREQIGQEVLQQIAAETEARLVQSLMQMSGLLRDDIYACFARLPEVVHEQVRDVVLTEMPQIIRHELETSSPPPDKSSIRAAPAFFVGREAELAYYAGQLKTRHLAVLTGIAGLGKTELAVRLARKSADEDRIFWHTFHDDEDLSLLLWKVAEFLYWQNQQDLWRRLNTVGRSGGKAPPEILLEYLMPAVRGREYLFCLDGLPFVERDSQMGQFLEKLLSATRDGQLSLIVTSRNISAPLAEFVTAPLSGLTAGDAQQLLASQGVSLTDEQFQLLHQRTDGNPQLLMLSADLLRRSTEPAEIIDGLFQANNIQRYLYDEIGKSLDDEQKHTLRVMSALFGHPASRGAVEALLDGASARDVLLMLSERYLVVVHGSNRNRLYTVHPVLQEYFYDDLSHIERPRVHQRAGKHYETKEVDTLEAALQYQHADLTDKAIGLATSNAWRIITQGHARRLQRLLESLLAAAWTPTNR